MLTSHIVVINPLLRTHATYDSVAEAEAAHLRFAQLLHQSASGYSDALCTEAIRMGQLYDEGQIKSLFSEGAFPNLRQSVRTYWGGHKGAEITTLSKYADSLTALRRLTEHPPQTFKKRVDRGTSQDGSTTL